MIAGIALLVIASTFRLLPKLLGLTTDQAGWMSGFSPMAAIILCGAAFLPRKIAFTVPFAALLVTDVILNLHYGYPALTGGMLVNIAAFALIAAGGWALRKNRGFNTMLPAAIGGAVFFYIVSNTFSWLTVPGYPQTFSGWIQSLTVGLPGYSPTWTFFRNELISNILFTTLFVGCMRLTPADAGENEPTPAPARW